MVNIGAPSNAILTNKFDAILDIFEEVASIEGDKSKVDTEVEYNEFQKRLNEWSHNREGLSYDTITTSKNGILLQDAKTLANLINSNIQPEKNLHNDKIKLKISKLLTSLSIQNTNNDFWNNLKKMFSW